MPRRVVVFGFSSMPAQVLEALAILSRYGQVLLCVHNPCRHHWGDIVADKDLLGHAYRRQPNRRKLKGISFRMLLRHIYRQQRRMSLPLL